MVRLTFSTYELCQILTLWGMGEERNILKAGETLQRVTKTELEIDPKSHLMQPPTERKEPFYSIPDK